MVSAAIQAESVRSPLQKGLEQRFEDAVLSAMAAVAGMSARRVANSDQKRHLGRMSCCQIGVSGQGFTGALLLLFPVEEGQSIAAGVAGAERHDGRFAGPDIAEGYGTMAAAVALEFARGFADESRVTLSMPTLITGGDVAVSFPWGNDVELRSAFTSEQGNFWALLRLSHVASN